jgi:steroid 5-alpha reductase family enzyme
VVSLLAGLTVVSAVWWAITLYLRRAGRRDIPWSAEIALWAVVALAYTGGWVTGWGGSR